MKKYLCWVEKEEIVEAESEAEALSEFEKGLDLNSIERRCQEFKEINEEVEARADLKRKYDLDDINGEAQEEFSN
jgi:hypothetical protein